MGRHAKTVRAFDGTDRREVGYYSTPDFVARYLAEQMLSINPSGSTLLDPCTGREELLTTFIERGLSIDSIDICRYKSAYASNFQQRDFLRFYADIRSSSRQALPYDFYVANPPYNCHEVDYIRSNKSWLSQLFPDVGTANLYSMFISAMIDLARDGAVIGLVTLDSFMHTNTHAALRRQIVDFCTVRQLLLCPTDLFRNQSADVRACVMILQKGKTKARALTLNRTRSVADFGKALQRSDLETSSQDDLLLSEHRGAPLVIGCPAEIRHLFRGATLGDSFRCATGISTGDDRKYLRKTSNSIHTVPFYKNPGTSRYFCRPDAFLVANFRETASRVNNFIVRNANLLFREGIVCSSMGVPFSACHLPAGATFGVNPAIHCQNPEDIWWLLAYLNSNLVSYLIRGVMLRSNMITSGYLSRLPLVELSKEERATLSCLARQAYRVCKATTDPPSGLSSTRSNLSQAVRSVVGHKDELAIITRSVNEIVYHAAGISPEQARSMDEFCQDIIRLT